MASKRNGNNESPESNASNNLPEPSMPAGYEERGADIVGFWKPEHQRAIHIIPIEAKLFDGDQDKSKPSILIFAKLVESAVLINSDGDKTTGNPGDMIGVWGKPGLRALRNLAGIPCFIFPSGEKDVGKGNPMQLFKVGSKGIGKRLQIVEDMRIKSRQVATWLDDNASSAEAPF